MCVCVCVCVGCAAGESKIKKAAEKKTKVIDEDGLFAIIKKSGPPSGASSAAGGGAGGGDGGADLISIYCSTNFVHFLYFERGLAKARLIKICLIINNSSSNRLQITSAYYYHQL